MTSVTDICCAQGALAVKTVANTITLDYIKQYITFMNAIKMRPLTGSCTAYADITASGVNFEKGSVCGTRNPQTNQYKRRQANIQDFHLEKIICGKTIQCSPYSISMFASNVYQEIQNAFINTLKRELLSQLMNDTINQIEDCNGGITPIKAEDDSLKFGTSIPKIDSLATDKVVEMFTEIVNKFTMTHENTTGITILAPASFGSKINAAFASFNCCDWYNSQTFTLQTGFTINGKFARPVKIIYLEDYLFQHPVTGYTRIVAFADNTISFNYATEHLYNMYSNRYFAPSFNANPNILSQVIDMRAIPVPEHLVGVGLIIDAAMHFVFMRDKPESIMFIDVKDTALASTVITK